MRQLGLVLLVLVAGCNKRDEVELRYQLQSLQPADVIRLETIVDIDPADGRTFEADQPYRQVAIGVGFEVRDLDGSGRRKVLITHDSTIGYVFTPTFQFTVLPPVTGTAPKLAISARAVGISDTLGSATLVTAAFGKGAGVDVDLTDQRCDGVKVCDGNETCCPGMGCRRLDDDVANCAACGTACGTNQTCAGSACQCNGGSGCTTGMSCCVGLGCIDPKTDPSNCGGCGTACHPGETCTGSACQCNGGAACQANEICCEGSGCSSTGCVCGGNTCTGTQKCCAGNTCKDIATDNANCGACGTTCPAGLACSDGKCKCQGFLCTGSDACCSTGCANLQNDIANCGACAHKCNDGETCSAGICQCNGAACNQQKPVCCGAGMTKACANLTNDPAHCGDCGVACAQFESCTGGNCVCAGTRHCLNNETCCTGSAAQGCFDLSNDPNNCGACGMVCSSGQQCIGGMCKGSAMCTCTNGNTCGSAGSSGTQACVCGAGQACGGTQFCCNGSCVDRQSDGNNCGACNNACNATSELCCGGSCVSRNTDHCVSCTEMCNNAKLHCCPCGADTRCGMQVCLGCGGGGVGGIGGVGGVGGGVGGVGGAPQ